MKTRTDPRHQRRLHIVQALFAAGFSDHSELAKQLDPELLSEVKRILASAPSIDRLIEDAAPQFPVSKIAKVDVAILRLALYELQHEKKTPPKVVIDEAVELAKELGGEGSPTFVNGVLGKLYKEKKEPKK